MPFITKLDYSDNRQIKQHIETFTRLSGGTVFGVPFSDLPTGPDLFTTGVTQTITGVTSTFSGNSGTTVYTWGDTRMVLGEPNLSAITPSNSGTSQQSGSVFAVETTTIIDGNTVALTYSGVNFGFYVTNMVDLGSGAYSGNITTSTLDILSAGTLDFTGRTIWNDVSGITRTQDLIITRNPQVGYVWTCTAVEGKGSWSPSSGTSATTNTFTTGATLIGSTVYYDRNDILSAYTVNLSALTSTATTSDTFITGGTYSNGTAVFTNNTGGTFSVTGFSTGSTTGSSTDIFVTGGTYSAGTAVFTNNTGGTFNVTGFLTGTTSGGTSYWSASTGSDAIVVINSNSLASGVNSIAEGSATTASANYSHAEGENTIASGESSHAEGSMTIAGGLYSHAEGQSTSALGDYSHAEGLSSTAILPYSHVEGGYNIANGEGAHAEGQQTTALGNYAHAEGFASKALNISTHTEGHRTTALGLYSHAGGYETVASGETSFVHGSGSTAGGTNTIVLGGGITGTTNDTTYVDGLNIRTVGAGPTITGGIDVDINGYVVFTLSDARLKENISTITSALDTVKQLRGVTYNWKDRNSGGDNLRLGFIAQEVESVIPELTFVHEKTEEKYKGVQYNNVSALLVEAIKELASGVTSSHNTLLETQTILAEDNNIELNYNGTEESAIGGGITVLHGMGNGLSSEFITDENGNWTTNNTLIPNSLVIPTFTPTSSSDIRGNLNEITKDDNYLYIKTTNGWKRSNLESF